MAQATTRLQFVRWFAPETLIQSIGIGLLLTVASRVAALGRSVVFARLMDRAELGTWAITNNTMQMLSVVFVLGIPAGLCRYAVRYQREGRLRRFLNQSLTLSFGICVVASLLGLVLRRPLAQFVYEDPNKTSLVVLLCLGSLSLMALNLLQGVMQGLRVYRINAVMLVVQSVGFAALGSVLLVAWQPTALAGAWAFVTVSAIITAVPAWMLWRHVRAESGDPTTPAPSGMMKQLLAYSLGTWGASSLYSLLGVLDRYMLIHFDTLAGTECLREIGTYHIVDSVTGPLLALGAGWSVQVLAHTVHLWESKQPNEAGRLVQLATKLTVLTLTLGAAILLVLKHVVLADIFGDVSMESGEILKFVLVSTILLAGQCMIRCYVLCHERSWFVTAVWMAGLAVSFGLNYLLIPVLHLKGATITSVASSATTTVLLMWMARRVGLRLAASTCAVVALPLVLLLPPPAMLCGLAVAAIAIARTEWLLSTEDKEKINDCLSRPLARRSVLPSLATTWDEREMGTIGILNSKQKHPHISFVTTK